MGSADKLDGIGVAAVGVDAAVVVIALVKLV